MPTAPFSFVNDNGGCTQPKAASVMNDKQTARGDDSDDESTSDASRLASGDYAYALLSVCAIDMVHT